MTPRPPRSTLFPYTTLFRSLSAEKARRHDDQRENDRRLRVSGGQPCEPLLLAHNAPPITHDAAETFAEVAEFVGLAMVERHALGVLAETDEVETEVGFVALLVKVQPDQRTSDPIGEPGTREGIQESRPYQIARQPERETRNGECPRESPENRDERDQAHHGAHSASAEIQRTGDELGHILSHALVGIVSLPAHQLHSVVGVVGQPPAQIMLGEPMPPRSEER